MNSKDINPFAFLDDSVLRDIARDLFVRLDMTKAFESDYQNALVTLRRVYNLGRSRGAAERPEGQ